MCNTIARRTNIDGLFKETLVDTETYPVRVIVFHVQNTSKKAIFHEYPNDCKCDIDLNNS